jgi:hypothetical protein
MKRKSLLCWALLLFMAGMVAACGGPPRPPGAGHLVPSPVHPRP